MDCSQNFYQRPQGPRLRAALSPLAVIQIHNIYKQYYKSFDPEFNNGAIFVPNSVTGLGRVEKYSVWVFCQLKMADQKKMGKIFPSLPPAFKMYRYLMYKSRSTTVPFTAASYLRTVSFILFKDKFMLNRRVVDLESCRNKGQEVRS